MGKGVIKRDTSEIIGSEMQLLDGRSPSASGYDSMQGQGGFNHAPQQAAPQQKPQQALNFDDDIPF